MRISNPKKIGSIFSSSAITATGETFYLVMEPMSEEWIKYRKVTALLIIGELRDEEKTITFGSLEQLCSEESLTTKDIPDFWTKYKLLLSTFKRKLSPNDGKALRLLNHASSGLKMNEQTHVVFASKVPITDAVKFKMEEFSFEAYVKSTRHVIMSVGVSLVDEYVENRGIFRNPLSILEKNFRGISMMLHSFTCKVIQRYLTNVKTFVVRPLKKMTEIFLASLPREKMTIDGVSGEKYIEKRDEESLCEPLVMVPTIVLASLY